MTYSKYKIRLTQTETIREEDGRGEKKRRGFCLSALEQSFTNSVQRE